MNLVDLLLAKLAKFQGHSKHIGFSRRILGTMCSKCPEHFLSFFSGSFLFLRHGWSRCPGHGLFINIENNRHERRHRRCQVALS